MAAMIELPAFAVTQRALTRTTERLARELASPDASAPDWDPFEWSVARAVATLHGISGLLAHRLRWRGPAAWQSFLAGQLEQSCARETLIRALLARLEAAALEQRVAIVPLKGAVLLALDVYLPGERPMGDIDLLVRAVDLEAASAALRSLGFEHAFSMERHLVFRPVRTSAQTPCDFGEHIANPIKIEVHTRIAEPLPMNPVDITRHLEPSVFSAGAFSAGLHRPDEVALMRHLLLHAAGNMRAHALRFLQLHDIALLARRFAEREWDLLIGEPRDAWWMIPPLALASNYFPGAIPEHILRGLRAVAPRAIARVAGRPLTEVSWSNLKIHAFPGIGWSRSSFEALRFAASRVLPRRAAVDGLREAVHAMPQLGQVPWYELPHSARIIRWAFGRPPRVQTAIAVCEALRAGARS